MPLDSRVSESTTSSYTVGLEPAGLDAAILALTDRAFGPGRYVKTAERLRESNAPLADTNFVAWSDERLIGSVRLWPVVVHDAATATFETIAFLGPIVVDADFRKLGIGKHLIRLSLDAATKQGLKAVLLVGDAAYFAALGFTRADGITLPGPVDPRRVLIHYPQAYGAIKGHVMTPDAALAV